MHGRRMHRVWVASAGGTGGRDARAHPRIQPLAQRLPRAAPLTDAHAELWKERRQGGGACKEQQVKEAGGFSRASLAQWLCSCTATRALLPPIAFCTALL